MTIKANSPILLAGLVALAVLAIAIHSSQYLPASGLLFATIVAARLLIAVAAGVGAWVLLLIGTRIFLPKLESGTVLNICGLVVAAVAVAMALASHGVPISETLLEIYQMRG